MIVVKGSSDIAQSSSFAGRSSNAAELEAEHEIDEGETDYSASRDVCEREIGSNLLSHESQAERVENVIVGDRQQVVLGYDSNASRNSQLAARHSYRLSLNLATGEAISAAEGHARVVISEGSDAV